MAFEFVAKNGIISKGNVQVTGSVIANSFTGSLQGTSSNAVSSSYAVTASFSLNAGQSSGTTLFTGSTYEITSSWAITASSFSAISGSNLLYLQCNDGNTYAVTLFKDGLSVVLSVNQTPVSGTNNFLNIGTISSPTSSYFTGSFVGTNALTTNIKSIISDYTASNIDYTILCKHTASINIYLTSSLPTGTILNIKNATSGTFSITVSPSSGTIDGETSFIINTAYTSMNVQYDGINWWNL